MLCKTVACMVLPVCYLLSHVGTYSYENDADIELFYHWSWTVLLWKPLDTMQYCSLYMAQDDTGDGTVWLFVKTYTCISHSTAQHSTFALPQFYISITFLTV